MTATSTVIDDLEAEQERLEAFLSGLNESQWQQQSATPPWTISDVVLHLAQTEEAVVASLAADMSARADWGRADETLDEAMARRVADEQAPPQQIFERWQSARRAALHGLRAADPKSSFQWATTPLRPNTLATTRLAEHWAHGLDVTEPFDADYPDTDRLKHIAWLAHATLPYALALKGFDATPVYVELTGPSGDVWRFGPDDASDRIVGAAGAFCRVAAQRLAPDDSGLHATGPNAGRALSSVRTYAA